MAGSCPVRGHWKCSLQTQPLNTPWRSRIQTLITLGLVGLVGCAQSIRVESILTPLQGAVHHRPSPSAPATAAAGGAKSRSKPQRGRRSRHFLEVLASVQGKSWRGITGHPPWGGDRTLASSPVLSTSSTWTAAPGPCPLQRLHWFWGCMGCLAPVLQHPLYQTSPPMLCSPAPQHHVSLFWGCCGGSGKFAKAFGVSGHWASYRLV